MRVFVEIGHIKNRGVIFWPERIRPVFPTLWSGHDFGMVSTSYGNLIGGCDQMGFSGTTRVCYGHPPEPFDRLKIMACP